MTRKTAIIIGASSEIGKETALKFAQNGYNLALTYNANNLEKDDTFKKRLNDLGCEVKYYKLNLLEGKNIQIVFDSIKTDFKCIDSLIYVCGISQKRQLIIDVSDEEIDSLFEINIKSAIRCTREFTKHVVGKNPANIVYVGSFVEKFGCSCESVYTATKSGLTGLCKSLATELGNYKIRCNLVAPGFIDTKMNNNLTLEEKREIAEMTPLKRLGTVQDIANAILFFASDNTSFITGQTLYVDGGLLLE